MRILITGASGLLGRALAQALRRGGHSVVAAGRSMPAAPDETDFLHVDFAAPPDVLWWESRLAGVDVVVNAAGIFREHGGQSFDAVHARGPAALFEASARAGVGLVIQVSALGSDAKAATAFHRSKRAGDEALRALGIPSVVVQPSLVYSPDSPSTQLFHRLAVSPLLLLPPGAQVQPVHLADVVAGLQALVVRPPAGHVTLEFVGPAALSLRGYLVALRRGLGPAGPAMWLTLPAGVFSLLGGWAGRLGSSLLNRDSVDMLLRGNTADPAPFARLLGREAKAPQAFVDGPCAPALRAQAVLGLALPLMNAAVAAVWIWTGLVSLGLYPVAQSLGLLSDFGLHGGLAVLALYTAAVLDLALGVLTLAARGRLRRWTLVGQLLLITAYTGMISATMPHWWLHPFGPLSKNLPMLAGIALLLAWDPRKA
jgi:uncharacterized protein YbjT (DUF2867 family)